MNKDDRSAVFGDYLVLITIKKIQNHLKMNLFVDVFKWFWKEKCILFNAFYIAISFCVGNDPVKNV